MNNKKLSLSVLFIFMMTSFLMIIACDAEYDGPTYNFRIENKTKGNLINVSIDAKDCGSMNPGEECVASYYTPPEQITVIFKSSSSNGILSEMVQTFTPDKTKEFDNRDLTLSEHYFSLWVRNATTDIIDKDVPANSVDYRMSSFTTSTVDWVEVDPATDPVTYILTETSTDDYALSVEIDNDNNLHFLGFFDRFKTEDTEDWGTQKLIMNIDGQDSADWTVSDINTLINQVDGGTYYSEVHFYGPNNYN